MDIHEVTDWNAVVYAKQVIAKLDVAEYSHEIDAVQDELSRCVPDLLKVADDIRTQLVAAEDERDALREALAFYADESNYDGSKYAANELFGDDDLPVLADNGTMARRALKGGGA